MSMHRGIRQRGSSYLVDVTVNGERKTATCRSLEEAITTRNGLKNALVTGVDTNASRANARAWTLDDALAKLLSLPKPDGWKGMSYEKQATLNAEDAMKFFGPKRKLEDIGREDVDAWLDDCAGRGNSDSTINRKRSALSKMMRIAVEYGGLAEMPKLPRQRKEPVGRIRQISESEEQQLIGALTLFGMPWAARAVAVLIDTGLRCGELWNVRLEDIDFKNRVLMVYGTEGKGTKNGKIRSVPLTCRATQELQAQCLSQVEIFGHISNSDLRHAWDKARAHMGLTEDKDFTPHVCRHTCASRLVKAGVSLTVVQAWLGHSNIQTTMRYAHLYPSDLMNAVKALEGDK